MRTADRLEQFHPFDGDILARVEEAADWQNRLSFSELADHYHLSGGPLTDHPFNDNRSVEYLALCPEGDFDHQDVRIYHAPFATPADKNMAMRAIRLFGAEPSKPLIVIGNPSRLELPSNGYRYVDLPKIWNGDFRPVAAPVMQLLENGEVTQADFIGFSLGADVAITEAAMAKDHGIIAQRAALTESVAVVDRSLLQLAGDFHQAVDGVDDAVSRSKSPALVEARSQCDMGLRYALHVLRISNLALAHGLSKSLFASRVAEAMETAPDLRVSASWGDRSELAPPEVTSALAETLRNRYSERFGSIMLRGMNHAGGDDIDLHAAIVLQGLKV